MTALGAEDALTPGAQRVLDAASELFYAEGIHAVGVERIAETAGVTKKTLYDRFGSKERLVLAYLRRREDGWRNILADHLANEPEPGIPRILAVFDAAMVWHGGSSAKGCSAVNARAETRLDGDDDPVLPEVLSEKAWLLDRFTTLCAEAGLPMPHQQAARLMLLFDGALVSIAMRTFSEPLRAARDTAADLLGLASSAGRT
ncbi:TetR/AcrR family transcriptional regulator [Curtobacterium sp. MCJR17_020]|uniref:TetR/AcrR family transcriptional regulator n=1 Tax=Curtobacterium sp. MCJR17_020 TaxID=2175619 RepID=UPI000DA977FE|nr:TetR/AcrR family transcriptional regulator [Curtobacterium sp. MCJR17_020]WIE70405.1 helix-turn-helix domain-containing protein [Curtobacterium sp. MCJR17_020]